MSTSAVECLRRAAGVPIGPSRLESLIVLRLYEAQLPGLASFRIHRPTGHQEARPTVPGTTMKFSAYDWKEQLAAFVICSSPEEPDVMSRAVERSMEARRALGPLGDAVLAPAYAGTIDGLSFAAYPYCRPLNRSRSGWIAQRTWVRPLLLRWLRQATRFTAYEPDPAGRKHGFEGPLENLRDLPIDGSIRDDAERALSRLRDGTWTPRHCLMHGDLWKENILRAPGNRGWQPFVLIDWPGSLVRGYGILDLVTVAPTLRLAGRSLRRELERHCRILGCELSDARGHLLAALGYIEKHRGYFPWERFVELASTLYGRLDSIGC